ncbi:MAG: YIP1 family protein [Myxococcaceae bacterium]
MYSVLQPARALFDPGEAIPDAVERRRWLVPLLILMSAVAFSGVAFALRWDASASVIRGLTLSGQLAGMTEQELASKITTAGRVALVGGVAKGLFAIPFFALMIALAVKISGWLIGRSITFVASFSATTTALLPLALYNVLSGVVALSSEVVTDGQVGNLIPSHLGQALEGLSPEMSRLASVVDVFTLWSTALLGLGYSVATGMPRSKSLIFALVLYAAWAGVFLVGLPAMGGGVP